MTEDHDELMAALHAAISSVYAEHGVPLVGRWIGAIEHYNDAGGRALSFVTAPDVQPWEAVGLSESMSEYARLALTEDFEYDEEDEENAE